MVPKLHAKGTSFKGAAAYLLHDKGAASSGRVAWVETVNLATNNPQAAWRVMAMTAMDAARLKEQAGVKKTGRTSKDAVLHLTLAWSPDQKPDRKDMAEFARRAIAALKADDRQAMIICHTDEKHPHVHILLNRVSPTDGRMLSSSKEKVALSEIALAYEKESGAILCKERAVNAEKRKKGEYVRAEKDIPRPEYEALREAQKETEKEIPAEVQKQKPELAAQVRATMRKQFGQRLETIWEQLRPYNNTQTVNANGTSGSTGNAYASFLLGQVDTASVNSIQDPQPQWRALYQRQRSETEKADRQKMNFVQQLAGWFGGPRRRADAPEWPERFPALPDSERVRRVGRRPAAGAEAAGRARGLGPHLQERSRQGARRDQDGLPARRAAAGRRA
jgi:hypothetical protein